MSSIENEKDENWLSLKDAKMRNDTVKDFMKDLKTYQNACKQRIQYALSTINALFKINEILYAETLIKFIDTGDGAALRTIECDSNNDERKSFIFCAAFNVIQAYELYCPSKKCD